MKSKDTTRDRNYMINLNENLSYSHTFYCENLFLFSITLIKDLFGDTNISHYITE